MILQGKGFFIWQIPNCENGDPQAIARLAKEAQLSHVIIKIADTIFSYNIYAGVDRAPAVVEALREQGIQVWGWHYVKGDDPLREANKAVARVKELDLDGYVIDAEAEYKQPGKARAAARFMNELREGLPEKPVALSSYRYPSYHPQLPWREFLEKCDFNMPQVYWMNATNPGDQLKRSVGEFQALAPFRPVIPTGSAFKERGWGSRSNEVVAFLEAAQSLNLAAANFYSWDACRTFLPELWEPICNYPWGATSQAPDITTQFINALNTRDPAQVAALYSATAVHVTGERTVQGQAAIQVWYQTLFNQALPEAAFALTGFSGSGNSRHFTWTATSSESNVHNGNDTFGLVNEKVVYHYSFFTVTGK
jgi:hypothetical protein